PRQRPLAQIELFRRQRVGDAADPPVGGSNHDPVAHRRHAHGIAEEIDAPERGERAEPTERRPQPEQQQARHAEDADERQALAVARRQLGGEGGENRHDYSAASARSTGGPESSLSIGRSASSTAGGLRLGAATSSSTSASFSRAAAASR